MNQIKIGKFIAEQRKRNNLTQQQLGEQFRYQADENIVQISKESAFTFAERRKYWINKWRKEHIGLFVFLFLIDIAFVLCIILMDKLWLIGCIGIILFIEYGWQNNRMMTYVENNLYV